MLSKLSDVSCLMQYFFSPVMDIQINYWDWQQIFPIFMNEYFLSFIVSQIRFINDKQGILPV